MKILLINPPVFNDIGRCKSFSPPLALLYLASYLEKHGFTDVKVIDADLAGITWPAMGNLLAKENPDIVGVGGPSHVLPAIIKTVEIARRVLPDCLIVTGGFGPSKEPEKVLKLANRAIDSIVIGEGEITLWELAKRWESRVKNFDDIAGLAFLNREGNLIFTKPRDYIMDLDSLSWPAFHLLYPDFLKYPGAPVSGKELQKPRATVLAARGCPHRCTFCSANSKLHRKRDPRDVVAEIEYYKNKFGIKSVQIYDDEFVGMTPKQNEWVREICEEMIRKKLNLPWMVQGRCSPYIELETLKKMKEAGCAWIWWGVESGSQKILDNVIHKDIVIENIYRDFGLAKKAGIKSLMFIMVGFPKETLDDIKLTSKLIKNVKPDDIVFHIVTPYPGSELFEYFKTHDLFENKLDNLADYYKYYDTNSKASHHTEEMTAEEINKYFRFLVYSSRFKNGCFYFINSTLKSLITADGWEKLFKRIRIAVEYFQGWLRINF